MKHPITVEAATLLNLFRGSVVAELRSLQVECIDDRVILHGKVGSYYHKQLAQELLRGAIAGLALENEIAVEYSETDCRPAMTETELT